jgi:hypothetical protein
MVCAFSNDARILYVLAQRPSCHMALCVTLPLRCRVQDVVFRTWLARTATAKRFVVKVGMFRWLRIVR